MWNTEVLTSALFRCSPALVCMWVDHLVMAQVRFEINVSYGWLCHVTWMSRDLDVTWLGFHVTCMSRDLVGWRCLHWLMVDLGGFVRKLQRCMEVRVCVCVCVCVSLCVFIFSMHRNASLHVFMLTMIQAMIYSTKTPKGKLIRIANHLALFLIFVCSFPSSSESFVLHALLSSRLRLITSRCRIAWGRFDVFLQISFTSSIEFFFVLFDSSSPETIQWLFNLFVLALSWPDFSCVGRWILQNEDKLSCCWCLCILHARLNICQCF